ncbi:hypothetical protein J2X35_003028 [Mesorhizobium sp. BE184]|nr:hypothetical protein [Mesorhizobium sp. BE184]
MRSVVHEGKDMFNKGLTALLRQAQSLWTRQKKSRG